MQSTHSKSKSLRQLREFCAKPPKGMISYWWFNGLVNAYPLHFLFFTQFSTGFKGTKESARKSILSRFQKRVETLLIYPTSEKQISDIERILTELDEIIKEAKQINNN